EYLAITLPGESRVSWLAVDGDEKIVGHASLLMLEDIGVLELSVRAEARRDHIGTALLRAVAERADEAGYQSLGVEVVGHHERGLLRSQPLPVRVHRDAQR